MTLTFETRQRIREERSKAIRSQLRVNVAEIEIREMCGLDMTDDEKVLLLLSRGESIASVVENTGCPKSRVEVLRQSLFGKTPAKPRSHFKGMDEKVWELRQQGLSYGKISLALGVSHKFVSNACRRQAALRGT